MQPAIVLSYWLHLALRINQLNSIFENIIIRYIFVLRLSQHCSSWDFLHHVNADTLQHLESVYSVHEWVSLPCFVLLFTFEHLSVIETVRGTPYPYWIVCWNPSLFIDMHLVLYCTNVCMVSSSVSLWLFLTSFLNWLDWTNLFYHLQSEGSVLFPEILFFFIFVPYSVAQCHLSTYLQSKE